MKRIFMLVATTLVSMLVAAQVTFVLESIPEYTPESDIIYIAGTINGWNPGDPSFALQKNDDELWSITLDEQPEGTEIKFKFTRGTWEKVEKGPEGEEISDRVFSYGNGETVQMVVHNWADFGAPQDSTAAPNVAIMHENFYMPQLDRTRRIWIYYPPDYNESAKSYPVLYMHDGQNLFETVTSFAGEWEVDETLNELAEEGYQVPIVIGIDNGGQYRTEELTPWKHEDYPTGRGEDYMAFIVETLKPHVDSNYRTIPDRENTGIMGSSLGGLISTFGAMKYQDVFSKSGPFSPAYWINNDSIWDFIHETGKMENIRFYQNAGGNEGSDYIDMMYQMEDSLKAAGFNNIESKVIEGGDHNEATWRDDFANGYLYLFDAFANDVPKREQPITLKVVPNPATNIIRLESQRFGQDVTIRIFDIQGSMVAVVQTDTNSVDVSGLTPGHYTITFTHGKKKYLARFIKK
jgi:predicted alpha/beta superfamily hydrolase